MIPGIDLNKIVDGRTLATQWEFYTINVKFLETLTHEQFCQEFPESAREIERASKIQDKLQSVLGEL